MISATFLSCTGMRWSLMYCFKQWCSGVEVKQRIKEPESVLSRPNILKSSLVLKQARPIRSDKDIWWFWKPNGWLWISHSECCKSSYVWCDPIWKQRPSSHCETESLIFGHFTLYTLVLLWLNYIIGGLADKFWILCQSINISTRGNFFV